MSEGAPRAAHSFVLTLFQLAVYARAVAQAVLFGTVTLVWWPDHLFASGRADRETFEGLMEELFSLESAFHPSATTIAPGEGDAREFEV